MHLVEQQNNGHYASIEQIPQTVESLRQYFATGVSRDYHWRVKQLKALKKMTCDNEQAILQALKADLHKPEAEAWASEVGFVTSEVDHALKKLKKWMRPRPAPTPLIAMPGKSYLWPDPLGVILIIGAWNYPYQLVLSPLVAAIAAGNCAVLKPSELSLHTSRLIADLLPEYLDSQAFAVIEGAAEETTLLLHQRFDHILYTGGERVGKIVMQAASEHLTPVTLELGGKSPCIVDSQCNLRVSADRITWSKWMNAGQTCVAPDYILVERQFVTQLVDALKDSLRRFYADASEQNSNYGRIINPRHYARLLSLLEGQKIIYGGDSNSATRYIAPTLVMVDDLDAPIMQQEIFGRCFPLSW